MSHLKPGDRALIIAGLIALLAGVAWFIAGRVAGGAAARADDLVVVCQNQDGFYRADPLESMTEYTVRSTHGTEEGFNTVSIRNGSVEVVEADCSNQICVAHDPIDEAGEQIVCLPHGLVVEVLAHEDDATSLVLN